MEHQTLQVADWIHGFLKLLVGFFKVTSNSIVLQFTVCVVPCQRLCKNLGKLSLLLLVTRQRTYNTDQLTVLAYPDIYINLRVQNYLNRTLQWIPSVQLIKL